MKPERLAKIEKLAEIRELCNRDLLELYQNFVRYDHYDYESPPKFTEMANYHCAILILLGISFDDIGDIIMARMENE